MTRIVPPIRLLSCKLRVSSVYKIDTGNASKDCKYFANLYNQKYLVVKGLFLPLLIMLVLTY